MGAQIDMKIINDKSLSLKTPKKPFLSGINEGTVESICTPKEAESFETRSLRTAWVMQ